MSSDGYNGQKREAPSVHRPGELLFECYVERTHTFYRGELRDHGPVYGVEEQFLDPVDPRICRIFRPGLDPTRTPREMAVQWAEAERSAIEKGGE